MKNRCMTVEELAELSNRKVENIRNYLRQGIIKGIKVGKEWRISQEEAYKFAGIKTDISSLERELKIKELEGEIKELKVKVEAFQVLAATLQSLLN